MPNGIECSQGSIKWASYPRKITKMKITKSQLRQIIKEEVKETLKEYINPNSSVNRRHRRFDHVPGRGVAPGTSGRPPDQTTEGAEELPECQYSSDGKKLGGWHSWAKAAGMGLVPGRRGARCAIKREKIAFIDKGHYEYDTFKGGLQKDDKGNPKPFKGRAHVGSTTYSDWTGK